MSIITPEAPLGTSPDPESRHEESLADSVNAAGEAGVATDTDQAIAGETTAVDATAEQAGTVEELEPAAADEEASESDGHGFWTKGRAAAAAVLAVLGIGGGVAAASMGGSGSAPRAAAASNPNTNPSGEAPNPTQASPTDIPSTVTSNPDTAPSGELDPTVPVEVPYQAGVPLTASDIEKLIHNLGVAITNGDMSLVRYSGMNPDSEFVTGLQPDIDYYNGLKAKDGSAVQSYGFQVNDKDILYDPNIPNAATVLVASGAQLTPALQKYATMNYNKYVLTLDHGIVDLPSGSKDIWRIYYIQVEPSTQEDWYQGL